ncbi:MAG: hypothetical protein IPH12_21415 [Saprospirales bacterium]|nr:hypothetical protein [Saprospirales bacterium]
MASKKNFVLRIDEATYEALEKWASDEFRSVNGQLEWIISRALTDAGRTPKERRAPEKKTGE